MSEYRLFDHEGEALQARQLDVSLGRIAMRRTIADMTEMRFIEPWQAEAIYHYFNNEISKLF